MSFNRLIKIADAIRYLENSQDKIKGNQLKDRVRQYKDILIAKPVKYLDLYRLIAGDSQISTLPEELVQIAPYAFFKYDQLRLTVLPDNITKIGSDAFSYCTNLTLSTLPKNLVTLSDFAFDHCTNLKLTSLPDGVEVINMNTFSYCYALNTIIMPSVTSIGSKAFYECLALNSVIIGSINNAVYRIAVDAFANCTELSSITIYTGGAGELANAPFGAVNATITYINSNS